ncbi:hypothetical protein AAGG74_15985 [Bacillus mexicanus]|uniref:hypothetical protein n=1 Tax=Bacillus mexicanus TaxID=2834415 RepID=UPI003D1EEC70
MIKKVSAALLGCVFAVIPFNVVNAESFTYTLTVEQPVLAVAVTSTATETEHSLKIDRNNPVYTLDTIKIENTGEVDAITSTKGTLTRTDGGTQSLKLVTSPSDSLSLGAFFYQPGTTTPYQQSGSYLTTTERDAFTVNKGQSIMFDLGLKFDPDFNSAFTLKAEFNSRAK